MKHDVVNYAIIAVTITVLGGCSVLPATNNSTSDVTSDVTRETTLDAFTDSLNDTGDALQDIDDNIELDQTMTDVVENLVNPEYYYPVSDYSNLRTKKIFGQYIAPDSGDRFSGYHTGDDLEVSDITVEVPVYVIADSMVVKKQTVSGYGGVVIIAFVEETSGDIIHALYGHLDVESVTVEVGDEVVAGEMLGRLGDDKSGETDGERKHLHFGLYPYMNTYQYAGYVQSEGDLDSWINPSEFLREQLAAAPNRQ